LAFEVEGVGFDLLSGRGGGSKKSLYMTPA
jgi:hypothetical protein